MDWEFGESSCPAVAEWEGFRCFSAQGKIAIKQWKTHAR